MEKHTVKVIKTEMVLYNVKRFTVQKPSGYTFVAGQATDVSLPDAADDLHPFTFTCLDDDDHLEFTIKIYKDHHGMTERLLAVNEGHELIIHEVFGSINYNKPGVFIAAGAGITPFIAILRQLKKLGELGGQTLLFANRTERDVILKDELDEMLGDKHIDVFSEPATGKAQRIDKELLKTYAADKNKNYYICGPDEFVAAVKDDLKALSIAEENLVYEK